MDDYLKSHIIELVQNCKDLDLLDLIYKLLLAES